LKQKFMDRKSIATNNFARSKKNSLDHYNVTSVHDTRNYKVTNTGIQ
jgi:hypothetical protein